jgi:hypothetical protein
MRFLWAFRCDPWRGGLLRFAQFNFNSGGKRRALALNEYKYDGY